MRALVLRGRVVPPLARGAREGDDLPHRLLRDLRDDAAPHRPPPPPPLTPHLLRHRPPRAQLPPHPRRAPPRPHRPTPAHPHPPPPRHPPPHPALPLSPVPRPVIQKMSSIGLKNGLSIARPGVGM